RRLLWGDRTAARRAADRERASAGTLQPAGAEQGGLPDAGAAPAARGRAARSDHPGATGRAEGAAGAAGRRGAGLAGRRVRSAAQGPVAAVRPRDCEKARARATADGSVGAGREQGLVSTESQDQPTQENLARWVGETSARLATLETDRVD